MKILMVADYWKGGWCWYHVKHLKHLGHDVHIFNYRKSRLPFGPTTLVNRGIRHYFKKAYVPMMNNHLLSEVERVKPELVFIIKGELLLPETLKQIKATGCKVINWYLDPFPEFCLHNAYDQLPHLDMMFVKDASTIPAMGILGFKNLTYVPEGFDEDVYKPVKLTPAQQKQWGGNLSLSGFQYQFRLHMLSQLTSFGLKVWGKVTGDLNQFPALKPCVNNKFLTVEEKNLVFNASKINLNVHHPREFASSNVRMFEICGAGGFQLVDHKKSHEEFFKGGKEIVYYKSLDELKELVKYYLDNKSEREEIARAGLKRAQKYHISDRIKDVMNVVKKLN